MAKNLCTRSEFIKALSSNLDQVLTKTLSSSNSTSEGKPLPLPSPSKSFTAYKLDGCPYSDKAGAILDNIKDAQSFYIHQDLRSNKDILQKYLHKHTNFDKEKHRTFPIIFAGNQFLGGHEELADHVSRLQHAGYRLRRASAATKRVRSRFNKHPISRRRSRRNAGRQGI